ncbi:MAG: UPF0175 family protein [Oscillatoria princeps RMCB-10]|jgi:predicted HTH domain antitoxin|nr:UPF0175 family protein [Oscillatoria princeps RMCB-10]
MQITIEIPDEVAQRLNGEWGSISRRLMEVFVAEAYRSGALSTAEVRRLLQLPSRLETHAFLQRMGVYLNYDSEELERDIQTIEDMRNP